MSHNTENPNLLRVALIGHSFITRLRSYVRQNPTLTNFNLKEDQFSFIFCARGGLRISQLVQSSDFLSFDIRPDLCFLQIGENDILSGDEQSIARNILSLSARRYGDFSCDNRSAFSSPAMGIIIGFQQQNCTRQQSSEGRIGCLTRSPFLAPQGFLELNEFPVSRWCTSSKSRRCFGFIFNAQILAEHSISSATHWCKFQASII